MTSALADARTTRLDREGLIAAVRRLGPLKEAGLLRHHGFMSEDRFETVGQVYCGVAPEFAMVAF